MSHQPTEDPQPQTAKPMTPADRFLANAAMGRNRWWGWVLGLIFMVLVWLGIGGIPVMATCGYLGDIEDVGNCEGLRGLGGPVPVPFLLDMYPFIVGIFGVWLAVRWFHKKDLTPVLTGRSSFDYSRVLFAIFVGLIVIFAGFLAGVFFAGDQIAFQAPNPWVYVIFFMLAVVLIPYQAGFEEVFFRGYILQGVSLLTRRKWVLVLVVGVLFTLPHLANPEPWEYGVASYVASLLIAGAFYALLTLLDGGIELAVGHHAINNIFIALVANTQSTAIPSPSLFLYADVEYSLFPGAFVELIGLAVALALLNLRYKWFNYALVGQVWGKLRNRA